MFSLLFNETGKLVLGIFAIVLATNMQNGYFWSQDAILIIGKAMLYTLLAISCGNFLFILFCLGKQIQGVLNLMAP